MSTIVMEKGTGAVTDPATGLPLPQRPQPGYYPGYSTLGQQAYWDAKTREVVLSRVTQVIPIRFFTSEEARIMQAVVDRVLPQDDRTPDRRIPILPTIDERLFLNRIDGYRYEDMPPDPDAYRLAITAFREMAFTLHNQHFYDLPERAQEEILNSIHDGEPPAAQVIWSQMNVHRFWEILVSDCASAYYSHPWAWDEIGYGGPAYPRAYMRLGGGQPEPWEVNEQRYEWEAPEGSPSADPHQPREHSGEQTHAGMGGTH